MEALFVMTTDCYGRAPDLMNVPMSSLGRSILGNSRKALFMDGRTAEQLQPIAIDHFNLRNNKLPVQ